MELKSDFWFTTILCCLCYSIWSQQVSDNLPLIIANDSLTTNQKITLFDSLISNHQTEKNFDLLLGDRLELSKWYYKQRNLDKAITYYKLNLDLMDSLSYDNIYFYRRNLNNLGYNQYRNFNLDDAVITFKKLLLFDEQDELTIRGAYYLAEINSNSNEYYQTLRYYEIANEIAKKQNLPSFIIRSAIGIGGQCKIINKPKILLKGINSLKEAAKICENLNNDIKNRDVYTIYNELGNLLTDRTDPDYKQGEYYYNKAMDVAMKLQDSSKIGNTYNDIGQIYVSEKKQDAIVYLAKALSFKTNTNDTINLSIINKNLSRHYLTFEDYDLAFDYIQKSIALIAPFDGNKPTNLPNYYDVKKSKSKFHLCAYLIEKAKIWIELADKNPNNSNYYVEALKTLKLADYLIEQSRLESNEEKSKLFWRKTATEIYLLGVRASLLSNNVEDAFYFIEKNKAFLLLEDMALRNTRNNSEIPKDVSEKELGLRDKITALEKLDNSNNSAANQTQLVLAKDKYSQFINGLDLKNRLYYKTLKPAEVIDFKTFKNNYLTENNAYLEYILDDEHGYGLLITKNETKLFEITDINQLKDLIIDYRRLLEVPFKDKNSIDSYNDVSYKIYNLLFPGDIQNSIIDKKLTIVPDYYLQNIPFESLTTSSKENSYLIYKNEISYAYSLTLLNESDKIKRNNKHSFVGFAPIDFPSGLPQLSNTKEELNSIENLFSSQIFINEKATRKSFFEKTSNTQVIHIASHANANDSISPWIAFYDSKINLNELYNYNNSAELVVLSACNTSLGELYKGEGVMSLSRAFFNTGSHSVLPTLWEVNDGATANLLTTYYTNLKEGQNKSLALHNAKLEYLETSSLSEASPYYWASFVLIGDTGTIELHSNFNRYYYLIFALVALILFFIIRKRKKLNS